MILVTGATGTIGSAAVAALKARGAKFKVGVRSLDKAGPLGVEAVRFDWDDHASYLPAFKGAEKLLLLAPVSDRAMGYTLQAVAAAKRAGIKHIAKLSVIGADVPPGISLGRLHLAGERELEASGIGWTMLRPTFFMQNFLNYYGVKRDADSQVYLAHAEAKVSWIDAADVGEVAAAVVTTDGHVGKKYELTGPEAVSSRDAVALLSKALGRSHTYTPVPAEAAAKAMTEMGAPLWMVDGFAELDYAIREGWSAGVAEGVNQVLGRAPRSFATWAATLKK